MVAAAFAAEVEQDGRLVVRPVSAPEQEQVSPRAAHSVALVALQVQVCPLVDSVAVHSDASPVDPQDAPPEQVAPLVVRSVVSPGDLLAYPLVDSVAVHSDASPADPLGALPEQVAPLVVRSVVSPGDLLAYPLVDSVAVHSDASPADPLGALPEQVVPLVVHSVALQAAVRLEALLTGPRAGYLAGRLEDDHWSPAAVSY